MFEHDKLTEQQLFRLLKSHKVSYAGNKKLKIYGKLSCGSGKRMNKMNRVFFNSEREALTNGYRPCGHCMKEAYKMWKDGVV